MKNRKNIFKFTIFFLIIVAVIVSIALLGEEIHIKTKEITKQLTPKA